jgi:hypothetical protein
MTVPAATADTTSTSNGKRKVEFVDEIEDAETGKKSKVEDA